VPDKKRLRLKLEDKVTVSDDRIDLVTVRISKVTTMPPGPRDDHDTEPPRTTPKLEES